MTNETREPVYVGIDVSKDSLEVALADKAASVRFINDEQGVKALLEPPQATTWPWCAGGDGRPGKALCTRAVPGGHDRGGGQSQAGA